MEGKLLLELAIKPALKLLGDKYLSTESLVLMLAIAYQESAIRFRAQVSGPARGFWQFESGGGITGVLKHKKTQMAAIDVCERLSYTPISSVVFTAISDNDILAACFARLLLYSDAEPLPKIGDTEKAWDYYKRNWRPGKPHPDKWVESYRKAVAVLNQQ